jgi:DNA uptake protein ComE-like DNA-binding protein
MSGNVAKLFASFLSALVCVGIANLALATEPAKPKTESKVQPKTPEATAEQVAAPTAEKPAENADQPKIKPMPQPKRPEALEETKPLSDKPKPAKNDKKKSLFVPPGLLSTAPSVVPYSPPGLGKLNLNDRTVTIEQIQRLPGVGVVWAPKILAGRPYRTFGDMARDGIPFTTIDALSRSVELGP